MRPWGQDCMKSEGLQDGGIIFSQSKLWLRPMRKLYSDWSLLMSPLVYTSLQDCPSHPFEALLKLNTYSLSWSILTYNWKLAQVQAWSIRQDLTFWSLRQMLNWVRGKKLLAVLHFIYFLRILQKLSKILLPSRQNWTTKVWFFLQKKDNWRKYLSQQVLSYFILVCLNENNCLLLILFLHVTNSLFKAPNLLQNCSSWNNDYYHVWFSSPSFGWGGLGGWWNPKEWYGTTDWG